MGQRWPALQIASNVTNSMMLQQAMQIDHSHPDSASSELILTGAEKQKEGSKN
jgi:hypothetical protein